MEYTFRIEDYDNIMATFKRAPEIAAKEFKDSLEKIAVTVVLDAQHNAPTGHYPPPHLGGNLKQSIGYTPYGTGFMVFAKAEYASYVDTGTLPHVILPKRGRFLAFQVDGKWVFAKRVHHPGSKGDFFFKNAVKVGEDFSKIEMQSAIAKIIEKL